MFSESPRIEIYCKDYRNILLQDEQKEKLKTFFRERKYHSAVKFWLHLFDNKDLIKHNTEQLINMIEECKSIGMISKPHRTKFEKFIMKKEIYILDEPLTIHFAQSSHAKFSELEYKLLNSNTPGTIETIRSYIKIFRALGVNRSKRFLASFKDYIKRIRSKLSDEEYTKIIRSFRSRGLETKTKKTEYDHFPPDFIYRFAKDKHFRKMKYSRRPGWFIKKGLHKRSISTGYSRRTKDFAFQQRDLFSQGKYYEAIRNYTIQYIKDGTINTENREDFKKVLNECAKISLITTEQAQILSDSLE